MTRELIEEFITEAGHEDVLLADGLDGAFIGITANGTAVYDRQRCVECMTEEGMDDEEAIEYLEYNTFSAYVGHRTPLFIDVFIIQAKTTLTLSSQACDPV
jgi:hypothetical protein